MSMWSIILPRRRQILNGHHRPHKYGLLWGQLFRSQAGRFWKAVTIQYLRHGVSPRTFMEITQITSSMGGRGAGKGGGEALRVKTISNVLLWLNGTVEYCQRSIKLYYVTVLLQQNVCLRHAFHWRATIMRPSASC